MAIIGASRRAKSIGAVVLANIIAAGFQGELYPIHPEADEIQGLKAYPSIRDVPEPVDLAILVIPADQTVGVVKECGKAGVKALLVLSSGFAEAGEEGVRAPGEAASSECARAGMRVVGPNSFGLINNDPEVRLNATLASVIPQRGRLGLFAQSGALGVAVLASAARRGLGISVFASAGNRVDVSGNDLMQYWIDDQDTDTVGLYLESMGNPRKFSRIARQLAKVKPVIVVSSGVSSFAAPPGHRTRVTNVPPQAFDALLRQAGVIRVENVHQLFDVAQLTLHQPLPPATGWPSSATPTRSAPSAPAPASAGASRSRTGRSRCCPRRRPRSSPTALDAAFADPEVDSVVAAFIPPLVTPDEEVHTAVRDDRGEAREALRRNVPRHARRGRRAGLHAERTARRSVPSYAMPEDGIRALNAVTRYAQWRSRDRGIAGGAGRHRPGARAEAAHRRLARGRSRRPGAHPRRGARAAGGLRHPAVAGRRGHRGRGGGGRGRQADLSRDPQVDLAGRAPPAGPRRRARRPRRRRVRCATPTPRSTSRLGPLGADRFVVQRMAVPGVSCVVRGERGPALRARRQLLRRGPADRAARRHRPPHPAAHRRRRHRPHRRRSRRRRCSPATAARPPCTVPRSPTSSPGSRCSRTTTPRCRSVELNPVNAWTGGVDVLGADVVVRPALVRKDTGRRRMT